MTITIRRASVTDAPSLSHICLLNADTGSSATYDYGELRIPGLVYAVPYVNLPTTWGFVMVDEDRNDQVVGYVLGSTDTRAFETYPELAAKYPPSLAKKPVDEKYMNLLWNMHTAPDACIDFAAAHLHINILPEYQKQGWGSKLIGSAVEFLKSEGLNGVWLRLDPRNGAAKPFYGKLGFTLVEGAPDNYMGLKF
ncbi:acyl-CoA N-acyltransferase [Gymnopus androsaceus JB14]|uniref:Acyl-CoA N-acyltransferase n=1 Tax=Gymnopus androsaceus JB14 TaxID=1447944 RepID=A0A6A4GEJ0_9AGAR|nr:acyl-CoA N-acyltransferase [Gymnopus androsaceus JB14]